MTSFTKPAICRAQTNPELQRCGQAPRMTAPARPGWPQQRGRAGAGEADDRSEVCQQRRGARGEAALRLPARRPR